MCLGVAFGPAPGSTSGRMGLRLPIGISVGLCLGLVLVEAIERIPSKTLLLTRTETKLYAAITRHRGARFSGVDFSLDKTDSKVYTVPDPTN